MVEALATAIGQIVDPRVRRAVGQGVGREARRDSRGARGRHRHRAHAPPTMPEVFVGAGSNADPERALRRAAPELERRFGAVRCSSVYRSAAVGGAGRRLPEPRRWRCPAGARRRRAARRAACRSRRSRAAVALDPAVCALDLDLLLYGARVDAQRRLPRPGLVRAAVRARAARRARTRARASRHG